MYLRPNILGIMASLALSASLASAQPATLSKSDQRFLDMAADTNMTEAHLGQLAETNASSADVKDFGQKLSRDHTAAYETLTELATKLGAKIPKSINVRLDTNVDRLADMKGVHFDRVFVRDEVQDHEKALSAFRREAKYG